MDKCDHLSVSICALSEWCKRPSSSINSKIYSSFSLNIPNYKFYVVSLLVLEKGAVMRTLRLHSKCIITPAWSEFW